MTLEKIKATFKTTELDEAKEKKNEDQIEDRDSDSEYFDGPS